MDSLLDQKSDTGISFNYYQARAFIENKVFMNESAHECSSRFSISEELRGTWHHTVTTLTVTN